MTLRRKIAVLAAVLMTVPAFGSVLRPAQAAVDFTAEIKRAVTKAFPSLTLRERFATSIDSDIATGSLVRIESVAFAGTGLVLVVERTVGATREVSAAPDAQQNGALLATARVSRAGAGARTIVITSTADEWGPGLLTASWSERPGVNYAIVLRGAADRQPDLLRLARALPKDGSTVRKAVRAVIKKAAPVREPDVDRVEPAPDMSALGTGNKIVDGSGTVGDDLTDEATLCSGCGYWSGNWAGMWQYLLYAEGLLGLSGIDCQFGSVTKSATRSWQRELGLHDDGIVGPDTRGATDNNLRGSGELVTYVGDTRVFRFVRDPLYRLSGKRITYNYSGGILPECD